MSRRDIFLVFQEDISLKQIPRLIHIALNVKQWGGILSSIPVVIFYLLTSCIESDNGKKMLEQTRKLKVRDSKFAIISQCVIFFYINKFVRIFNNYQVFSYT